MQLQRIAALLAVLATTAFAQNPLHLAVGAQKTLRLLGIQRVALGDPSVADVQALGNSELIVIGVSAGRTRLLVWKAGASTPETFEVTVSGPGSAAAPPPPLPMETTPVPSFSATLKVGEQTTRSTINLQRIAIGDPAIADLRTTDATLTIAALAPGKTNVLLWFADGHREQWLVTVVK
ncbi:MAG: pilus assembly protein N-terminal domain-containing protein [Archangium sp.]|nr:pilus assembly protein N-terminal domain-containing protein [Archangium sp.]